MGLPNLQVQVWGNSPHSQIQSWPPSMQGQAGSKSTKFFSSSTAAQPFALPLPINPKMFLNFPPYLFLLFLTFPLLPLPLPVQFFWHSKSRHSLLARCYLFLLALFIASDNPNVPLHLRHPLLQLSILPLKLLSPFSPLTRNPLFLRAPNQLHFRNLINPPISQLPFPLHIKWHSPTSYTLSSHFFPIHPFPLLHLHHFLPRYPFHFFINTCVTSFYHKHTFPRILPLLTILKLLFDLITLNTSNTFICLLPVNQPRLTVKTDKNRYQPEMNQYPGN